MRGGCRGAQFGDGNAGPPELCGVVACAGPYGPWAPPPPEPSSEERTYTHTDAEAGTYTASFHASTVSRCTDPYFSSTQMTVEVVVP